MADDPAFGPDAFGQPSRLTVSQAFGFQIGAEEVTAQIQQTIDQAQQVRQALASQVSNAMTRDVAQTAVFTDTLKNKLASSLADQVGSAQQQLANFQQPIYANLVNQLGGVIESAIPLGVNPASPGETANCPTCVVIREAATRGDLGPAFSCYTAAALPLRDTRGLEYDKAVNFILACLPTDQGIRAAFQSGLARLQNEPMTPVSSLSPPAGVSIQAGAAGQPQMGLVTPQAAPGSSVPPGMIPGSGPPPADMPGATYAGATILPSLVIGSGPGATVVPQALSPPAGMIPGSGPPPGGVLVVPTNPLLTAPGPGPGSGLPPGAPPGSPQPGALPGSGPPPSLVSPPGSTLVGSGAPPVGGQIPLAPTPGVVSTPGAGPNGETLCTNQYGQSWLIPAGMTCGSGPPPPGPTEQLPPGAPPPGSTYRPEVPAKPPPAAQPCIKICPPDEKPVCTDKQYCVWQDGDTRVCYVLVADQPPRRPFDKKLICGTPSDSWLQAICQACGTPQPQPPSSPPGGGPAAFGDIPGCNDFGPIPNAQVGNGLATIGQWLGILDGNGNPVKPFPNAGATDIGQNLVNTFVQLIAGPTQQLLQAVQQFLAATGCADGTQIGLIATGGIVEFAQRFLGTSLDQVAIPVRYQRNYRCPVGLPTADQAGAAFMGDTIDAATLECWTRANGFRFPEFARVIDAARRKLDPFQYATLLRRDVIDQATYERKCRETGVLRTDDVSNLYRLTEQLPPASDLVRFMVRDAGDEQLVQQFRLDEEFEQKFTAQIRDWADRQGVDRTYMRYIWRAHWSIPAPGQLATMLHRLSRRDPGDPAFVDLATIKAALVQQDIAPFWIDKFVAISYSPLTRIDARRAYEIGALDAEGLRNSYLDLGYSPDAADTLVEFNRKNVIRGFLRRPEVKEYAAGKISEAEFTQSLQTFGASDEAVTAAKSYADVRRSVGTRTRCTAAARTRFLKGEFGRDDAAALLTGYGVSDQAAAEIVNGWQCELQARGKLFSVPQLNALYEDGLISDLEYVQRAQRLGWDQDDAVRLLRSLQRRLGIKIQRQQLAALEKQQREAEKLQRQLQQAAQRQQQDADRAKASGNRLRKLRELRTKRLIEAAEKFSRNSGQALSDALPAFNALYRAAVNAYPVTNDEIIQALVIIAGDQDITTLEAVSQLLSQALTTTATEVEQLTLPTDPAA